MLERVIKGGMEAINEKKFRLRIKNMTRYVPLKLKEYKLFEYNMYYNSTRVVVTFSKYFKKSVLLIFLNLF
jgi:hypothetical protein